MANRKLVRNSKKRQLAFSFISAAEMRRTGKIVGCSVCGKLHYRKLWLLKKKFKNLYCSKKCQTAAAPKQIVLNCETCGKQITRFPSQNMAHSFCSVGCRNSFALKTVTCFWPGCADKLKCRIINVVNSRGKKITQYKTDLRKRGNYTQYPFCARHSDLMNKYLGADARFTGARSQMLADQNKEYDCRALSSRFTRMIVFDVGGAKCHQCERGLDWNAPRNTWQLDHIIPIFRGGRTKLSNLQILCYECHASKTSLEKSEIAKLRWGGRLEHTPRRLTHYEKDRLIDELRAQTILYEKRAKENPEL